MCVSVSVLRALKTIHMKGTRNNQLNRFYSYVLSVVFNTTEEEQNSSYFDASSQELLSSDKFEIGTRDLQYILIQQ